MYDDKRKINSVYFNKKKNKNKKLNSYICLVLISIFIFFIYLNINTKKSSENKIKNITKNSKNNNVLPPKPKEKWEYIHKLENL